jgi:hypothetical protein
MVVAGKVYLDCAQWLYYIEMLFANISFFKKIHFFNFNIKFNSDVITLKLSDFFFMVKVE